MTENKNCESCDAFSMIENAKSLQSLTKELEAKKFNSPEMDPLLFLGTYLATPILLSLALEIALKALLCREREKKSFARTHDLLKLFERLKPSTKKTLETRMRYLSPHSVWADQPGMQNLNSDLQDILAARREPFRQVLDAHRDSHTHWR